MNNEFHVTAAQWREIAVAFGTALKQRDKRQKELTVFCDNWTPGVRLGICYALNVITKSSNGELVFTGWGIDNSWWGFHFWGACPCEYKALGYGWPTTDKGDLQRSMFCLLLAEMGTKAANNLIKGN